MYKEFYHLHEVPFNVTADPDFFFSSSRHAEAFDHLMYGIRERRGIIVMTGEVGTGKTTLCRTLLNRLDSNIKTALILNPSFSALQLLQIIVKDLGIEGNFKNKFDLVDALNNFLLKETSKGNNVVIIIDEAQNLGTVRYHIPPLDREELQHYINHRLTVAQNSNPSRNKIFFTSRALDLIYENSRGTPRMINILCDRALLAGYIAETYTIDEKIIQRSAEEVACV